MESTLRDGSKSTDPRLGRLVQFDERSRNYPLRTMLTDEMPVRSMTWRCDPRLDQGSEGACVGFAWSHELAAYPVVVDTDDAFARSVYRAAQKLDPWPGEDYEGTSVLAGAKAVQDLGHMDEYRWAFGIDDVLRAIGYHGPVVVGVQWQAGMREPRPSGLLEVDQSGGFVGGHAILLRGLTLKSRLPGEPRGVPVVRFRNSWGADWGSNGDCFMHVENLAWLLDQQGECCIPVARRRDATPLPDAEAMAEVADE